MSDIYYWWCPQCKCEVDGANVTLSEHHDICGYLVESITASDKDEIARLREELERYKCELGQACIAALQEDYSVINDLSRTVIITFDKDNIIARLPEDK